MHGMRTGLRHRLERSLHRIEEQHRQLREIGDELDRAVAVGSPGEIETWLSRFHLALRSHFDLEERSVFPAIHGLDESAEAQLSELEREHRDFLRALEALLTDGGGGSPSTLIDALAALREKLRAHEQREETLVEGASDGLR